MTESNGTALPPAVTADADKKILKPNAQASVGETMSFVFGCGAKTTMLWFLGFLGGIGNGLVYPILAYLFSNSFAGISNASASQDGLDAITEIAFLFLAVGAYALVMATIQTTCFEVVAYSASQRFRLEWFHALLRQDPAFFDVHDISGISSNLGPASSRYRRGVGRKFGEGIQFLTTGIGGVGYSLYASWRAALVVIAVIPFVAVSAIMVVNLNQTKSSRAAQSYSRAGSVAYSTVSAIKTVLSLNATPTMIKQYSDATQDAFKNATSVLLKQGFANGSMLGSFICLYAILCLYGTSLLYKDIEDTGCDPSNGVGGNDTCDSSGPDVFGAMLGVAFAAQGVSQVGNFLETFANARAAAHAALQAINRKPGQPKEIVYAETEEEKKDDEMEKSIRSSRSGSQAEKKIRAVLPEYAIDSSSTAGLKPKKVDGHIKFENVSFAYPTRPDDPILTSLSIDIEAGKTIAFVGPSGGGKSTIVKMLERFYDPIEGAVCLDGINIKDINVRHLRSCIGYVGQEPTLFATTIAQNIKYGNPSATQEQVEEAARLANAHDFITSFPDAYNTQVGDKGAQLSGGQKQRIAIARVLVANPSILLLDEATSALDSESEIVVQEALDNVLKAQQRTTVIIAHRLSTIRNADVIAVVQGGAIIEKGTHDELMVTPTGYYRKLVNTQENAGKGTLTPSTSKSSLSSSRENSENDLQALDEQEGDVLLEKIEIDDEIHIAFKDVVFSYPNRPKKKILEKFNLEIRKGETVALVGPSGGGKSTTVGLIERFYDPNDGAVEYSGVDIKSLNVAWYRDQIGFVQQEPVLFNDTIANNIAHGAPGATRQQIEEAARQANAYDFISSFPEGFDTQVGERGTQMSGGQKQRIAIARALVKKPEVLLLDEATSALDNESEAIVQEALDALMQSRERTCIVIAHRLSTVRNADRIAFIADGHIKEFGSHEELMEKPKGRYRRLVESQNRSSTVTSLQVLASLKKDEEEEEADDTDWEKTIEEEENKAFSLERVRKMASPDALYLLVGSIGALMAGSVFPMWGLLFAETIDLLFRRVEFCDPDTVENELGFLTCEDYWSSIADSMQQRSFEVAGFWAIVAVDSVVGNMIAFWGFGMASERLNKRTRDAAFASLVRQEIAFFDRRSVGSITSQLQDDAAQMHTFTGEPVRALLIALSSVFTGLVLSFTVSCVHVSVGVNFVTMIFKISLLLPITVHVAFRAYCTRMYSFAGLRNVYGDETIFGRRYN
jgi:ATP-binding cassette subfamily B (MDR/TAP) protein 1